MKIIVKLTVLMAALLLLNGVVLAFPPCDFEECYEVTSVNLDNPDAVIPPFFAKICLIYGNNIGRASICGDTPIDMSLFFDSMKMQALIYGEDCVQYIKIHGDNNHITTGIGYCENVRFTSRGIKTDMSKCNCT